MEVYREVKKFGGNEEESGCFDDFMPHPLDCWRDVGDMDWWVGDIHLGN